MNGLNEKNLGTAPDNPSMGDINDITASTLEKQGVIRNNSGNSTERTTKCRSWSCTSFNSANIKYILHTLLIAQIQIQRECPLFIRGFSNWAFFTTLTERRKQTIWCPVACTTVVAGSLTNKSKRQKWGENRKQWGTIPVNSSFEHDYCHHQKPAPIAPHIDYDCRQLQRRRTEAGK